MFSKKISKMTKVLYIQLKLNKISKTYEVNIYYDLLFVISNGFGNDSFDNKFYSFVCVNSIKKMYIFSL